MLTPPGGIALCDRLTPRRAASASSDTSAVAEADESGYTRAPLCVREGLGGPAAGGEPPVELEHHPSRLRIRHGHDARDDRSRSHADQRRREAEQLVAGVELRKREVAGGE